MDWYSIVAFPLVLGGDFLTTSALIAFLTLLGIGIVALMIAPFFGRFNYLKNTRKDQLQKSLPQMYEDPIESFDDYSELRIEEPN